MKNKSTLTSVLEDSRPYDYVEPSLDCSWDEYLKVVSSRRSVRVYDDTPVPADVVRNAIDAGLIAPTSSNLQQTEFYWARSPERKAALAKACLSQPAATTAQELVVIVARTNTWKRNSAAIIEQLRAAGAPKSAISYYESLVPLAYRNGPLGLLGIFKRVYFFFKGLSTPTPREPKSFADIRVWTHKSAALASENFMLAVRAQGFDTCPMEGFDSKRVKKILGLGCGAEVCMIVSVGKRGKGGVYGPRMRLPRQWFAFEI
jgi:nitroreductase